MLELAHSFKSIQKWIVRLPHDGDLLPLIEEFAKEQNIKAGRVEVIGAVKKAVVAFYNQNKREYVNLEFNEPMEILVCLGNLSLKDNAPKAHLHITLGDHAGNARGGHLMPGTIIFAGEAIIEALAGPALIRGFDNQTGLPLWEK